MGTNSAYILYAVWQEKVSEGLCYITNSSGEYLVSDIGMCKDKDIYIPRIYNGKNVVGIANEAFYQQTQIESITIHNNIKTFGDASFFGCSNIKTVYIDSLSYWLSLNFCYNNNDTSYSNNNPLNGATSLFINGVDCAGELTIPKGTKTIPSYAFYGWKGLNSLYISKTVTDFGTSTFCYCRNLTRLVVEAGATSQNLTTFDFCEKLEVVEAPINLIKVIDGSYVSFKTLILNSGDTLSGGIGDSGLTQITIPVSFKVFKSKAIYSTNITDVYYLGTIAQWNAISKSSTWCATSQYVVHCSDGDIEI